MSSSSSSPPSSSRPSSTSGTIRPTSRSLSSSTRVRSSTSVSHTSSYPSTSPTNSTNQGVFSSTLPEFTPAAQGRSGSRYTSVIITTLIVVGVLLIILLMLFVCCRRYRRNLALHARARDRCVVVLNLNDSTSKRQHSRGRKSFRGSTDEQMLEYAGNEFVIQGPTEQQSDESHVIWYGSNRRHSVEIRTTRGTNDRNPYLVEDPLDHHENPPKSHTPSIEEIPATPNRSLIISPSRAYLPFPNWRRRSRPPSSPSVHPVTLRAEEDGDSIRQLSTPMSILYPETVSVRNQDSDRDNITEKPVLRDSPVTPPNLEPDWGNSDGSHTDPYGDGPYRYSPPPIPPKSPLRKALSMRTMLNVQARESEVEL